jgi:hypothetical protein
MQTQYPSFSDTNLNCKLNNKPENYKLWQGRLVLKIIVCWEIIIRWFFPLKCKVEFIKNVFQVNHYSFKEIGYVKVPIEKSEHI